MERFPKKMKRKIILAITGIRSEYDIMSSVFREINKRKNLNLKLIVTGAHLKKKYGNTINEIIKDGFSITKKIDSLQMQNTLASRVIGLGIQLQKITKEIKKIFPDLIIVLGDREEAMTAALVSSYMNIPLMHIGGGDKAVGNVDDQIRHAVSKLSHIHFVSNKESESRLLKLGEQKHRVFNVGNPGIDRLISTKIIPLNKIEELSNFFKKKKEEYIVLIQHPVSSEANKASSQIKQTLEAIKKLKIKTIVIYPNSDSGSKEMIKIINQYKKFSFFKIIKNLSRESFVNILRNATCLVGNSSCGILEAPSLNLPVINIGTRQRGRLHSNNVVFINHKSKEIYFAIKKIFDNKKYRNSLANCKKPYGDGTSSKKIVDIIQSIKINNKLLIKDITY